MQQLLNRFPKLLELLACWYHQDTWTEFETDEQIWTAAFEGDDKTECEALRQEADNLMKFGAEASHKFIQANAEALHTTDPGESLVWLNRLSDWLAQEKQ